MGEFRVILSSKERENQYVHLHTENLRDRGICVRWIKGISLLNLIWISSNGGVFHIHWSHFHYFSSRGFLRSIASFLLAVRFIIYLLIIKNVLEFKIVWEMHNYLPHEDHRRWLDRLVLRFLLQIVDGIIGHCELTYELVSKYERKYKKKMEIIPHPSFYGGMREKMSKDTALEYVNITGEPYVYLFFGKIRPYKGVDNLIESFRDLSGGNLILVIAGRFEKDWYRREIMELVGEDERIKIMPGWVSKCEMEYLFSLADCMVLPYREVLTSGAVLLGLEFCIPMVLPRMGCLEVQVPEKCAVFYEDESEGLGWALEEVREREFSNIMEIAPDRLEELSWDVQIVKFIEFYESLGCR